MTETELVPVAFVDEGLGNSSYLLDVGDGRALVVDPARDATPYLAAAERAGLSVGYTVETHLHADFLTGSRELAARGATVLASRAAGIEWPHRGFGDGDELDLGGLRLRALATPGHTPEHLSWLLADGIRPLALFFGGALLVDAVARTDLIAPDQTEALARALWRSLHERILTSRTTSPSTRPTVPDRSARRRRAASAPRPSGVRGPPSLGWPRPARTHSSLCSSPAAGAYPPYFLRLRERNRLGPNVFGSPFPPLGALDVEDVKHRLEIGAVMIDARPVRSWAAGHIAGALSIPLRPQFASWLGWLVADDRPLVFVLDPDQDAGELVRQTLNVGYELLVGATAGDTDSWRAAGLAVETTNLLDVRHLDGPVVDVRQSSEHAVGHVPGAVHVELGDVPQRVDALPTRALAVMCAHGERAATAASLLEQAGRTDVSVVIGGPDDWAAGGGTLAAGS